MEKRIANILNGANARFYAEHAEGFSATRERPWEGWNAVGDEFCALSESCGSALGIIDFGCGNMRFEEFLKAAYPQVEFEFTCIDSCRPLVPEQWEHRFMERDIVSSLLEGESIAEMHRGLFDAAVAFGITHHIPGRETRNGFIRQLCACVKPGGLVAVSFWQFASVEKLASKAAEATKRGCGELGIAHGDLEEGDFFLGWANDTSALRYCHSFDDDEIGELLGCVADSAYTEMRYSADTANSYAILRVKA